MLSLPTMSYFKAPQKIIDDAWLDMKAWIESAAYYSLGYLIVKDHIAPNFWTSELEDQRNSTIQQQADLQESILTADPPLPHKLYLFIQ